MPVNAALIQGEFKIVWGTWHQYGIRQRQVEAR